MSYHTGSLDAITAAPEHHKVLFENDEVRVIETLIPPGESTKIHTHCWPGALYVRSWTDFIRYDENGVEVFDSRSMPILEEGMSFWSGALGPHFVTNVGTKALHVIATEIKSLA